MHKNYAWLCFLSLLTGAVGWIILKTFYLIYLFISLDASAPIANIRWEVKQLNEEKFVLKADYNFKVNDQTFSGETEFRNDIYWNPWAAQDALKVYEQKDWEVWYASHNPSYSSLQKNFPLKESVSSGILLVILLYFFGLGYYVATRKS